MNDLRALVDAATPGAPPALDGVLARRDQRRRRRRGLAAGAGVAALLLGGLIIQSLSGVDDNASPAPQPSLTPSESTSPSTTDRPDPTYTWSAKRSPLLVRTPERDVALDVWLGCWSGPNGNLDCVEEPPAPVAELPDVGDPEAIDFWFGVDGWEFEATFTQLGVDCPRSEHTPVSAARRHWFRLAPAGLAGDYRVDLEGTGPHGEFKGVPTMASFVWHTPVDGPVDQPSARVGASDLEVHALGYEPTSASAQVTITDANGVSTVRQLPSGARNVCSKSLDDAGEFDEDQLRGELYFQGDFVDPSIPELGPRPFTYRVRLTLDGTPYVGTAGNDGRVTWSPALPAYTG